MPLFRPTADKALAPPPKATIILPNLAFTACFQYFCARTLGVPAHTRTAETYPPNLIRVVPA
jgi:hypothetical protein